MREGDARSTARRRGRDAGVESTRRGDGVRGREMTEKRSRRHEKRTCESERNETIPKAAVREEEARALPREGARMEKRE